MTKFNKGDVVRLKSGSPDMTISAVLCEDSESPQMKMQYFAQKTAFGNSTAFYLCSWFEGEENKSYIYPEETLVSVV